MFLAQNVIKKTNFELRNELKLIKKRFENLDKINKNINIDNEIITKDFKKKIETLRGENKNLLTIFNTELEKDEKNSSENLVNIIDFEKIKIENNKLIVDNGKIRKLLVDQDLFIDETRKELSSEVYY